MIETIYRLEQDHLYYVCYDSRHGDNHSPDDQSPDDIHLELQVLTKTRNLYVCLLIVTFITIVIELMAKKVTTYRNLYRKRLFKKSNKCRGRQV